MERAVATTAYEGARPADADDRPAVMSLLDQGVAELTALRGGSIWHRREAHAEAEEEGECRAGRGAVTDERRRDQERPNQDRCNAGSCEKGRSHASGEGTDEA